METSTQTSTTSTNGQQDYSAAHGYASLGQIVVELAVPLFQPIERLSVSEAAERYRVLNNPGSYSGPWRNDMTPYMQEPMDVLASRDYKGCVFVGPAQCGKTDALLINWITYVVKVNPMDMIIYNPSQAMARDFSTRRIDRLHRHSPEVGAQLKKSRDTDNKFDKHYVSGIILTLSWPSVAEFAGRPIPLVGLTDYDRMEDDIDGEGSPYDLASKRGTTFGSYAMTLAESSPSREFEPEKAKTWIASTRHEAPPVQGILALYNRGDRRRRYWECPDCKSWFEPEFTMLKWDEKKKDKLARAESVYMECPCCSFNILPDMRKDIDKRGVWIKDGQEIHQGGEITGEPFRSKIASFWLKGVVAAFVTWKELLMNFFNADEEFQKTGSQEALKKFYNTDLGEPYKYRGLIDSRLPEVLKSRAEPLGDKPADYREVPHDVRFLLAMADVQKNMFVVQVFGICPGTPFDVRVIDRFDIRKSKRLDADGDHDWVKPHSYLEDWDELIFQCLDKTYPLADGSGRRMQIKLMGCDSGGKEGVTTNAYNFVRRLRNPPQDMPELVGYSGRFQLLKGDPKVALPRARLTYPDAQRKDKFAAARGDVGVLLLNSNMLKDDLNGRLDCVVPTHGMFHFPGWLPDNFYVEMCAEHRDTGKGWLNPNSARNEAWDLCYYVLGFCASQFIKADTLDWNNPPVWAAEWDKNALVTAPDGNKRFAQDSKGAYDFGKFGSALA